MQGRQLDRILAKSIELYNRYRAPEAEARIVKVDGEVVVVEFRGPFCETCGVNDWVEDYKYVLEDVGVEARLEEVIEPEVGEDNVRLGVFRIRIPKRSRK